MSKLIEKQPFIYWILANQAYLKAQLVEDGYNNHVILFYYYEHFKNSMKWKSSSKKLMESLT